MITTPQEKLERISVIMNKLDGFYHLRERIGYGDLSEDEMSELIDEMETLVNN